MTLALLTSAFLGVGWIFAGAQTSIEAAPRTTSQTALELDYRISDSPTVMINLSGTTPINTWQLSAHGISGNSKMTVSTDKRLIAIDALTFSLPVCNLKGESDPMQEHAYTALKAAQYKNIIFELTSATIEIESNNEYLVRAAGVLSVAGVTRAVVLAMHAHASPDGSITFTGAQSLRMSDYNVERPSLLFGAIRACDEMMLTYSLIFTE